MIVRSLDANHDWNFGKGRNDYRRDQSAIAQSIETRLMSFLADCFFDLGAGIDWFNLLGSKDQLSLNLAMTTTILNTEGVTGVNQLSYTLDEKRALFVQYEVQTVYSTISSTFTLNPGALA